jgi:hypothetical protein
VTKNATSVVLAIVGVVGSLGGAYLSGLNARSAASSAKSADDSAGVAEDGAGKAEAAKAAIESLIREDREHKSIVINKTTWVSSHQLKIAGAKAGPFWVPKSFSGFVIIHGPGGNNQKVFVVGSDGNGQFSGEGGFVQEVGGSHLPDATLIQAGPQMWSFSGLPDGGVPILEVTLLGAAQSSQE